MNHLSNSGSRKVDFDHLEKTSKWRYVLKGIPRKLLFLGAEWAGNAVHVVKNGKRKSLHEVIDLAPQVGFCVCNFSRETYWYFKKSLVKNRNTVWKRSSKWKKVILALRFQREFMFLVQLVFKYQYVFPENLISHFLL